MSIRLLVHPESDAVAIQVTGATDGGQPFWHVIYRDGISCCCCRPEEMIDGWVELRVSGY